MTSRRVAPQCVENTDGYIVQTGSRFTMEYLEGSRKAIVACEFGLRSTALFVDRVTGWFVDGQIVPISDFETEIVIERVAAAERFIGRTVDLVAG